MGLIEDFTATTSQRVGFKAEGLRDFWVKTPDLRLGPARVQG